MSRPLPVAPRHLVIALLAVLLGLWGFGQALWTGDALLRELARNSLLLVLATLALALPLGTILAALVFRTDLPAAPWWRVLLVLPLFIPLPVFVGIWLAVFSQGGFFPAGSGSVWMSGLLPSAAVHAAAALPWVVLIVGVGLRSVEPELEEAALLDASGPRVFLRVTLRRAGGALLTAALLVSALAFGEMTVTDHFQYNTYAEQVYLYFSTHGALTPDALAAVPGMGLLALLLGVAFTAVLAHDPKQWQSLWRGGCVFRLGCGKGVTAAGTSILVGATLFLVLWVLVLRIGMQSRRIRVPSAEPVSGKDYERTWTASAAVRTLQGEVNAQSGAEWLTTLARCGLASALAVASAVPLAWWNHTRPGASPCTGMLMGVILAVPGPVLALGLIMLFNRPGPLGYVYDEGWLLVLGLALRVWPFVFLAVFAPIRLLPATLLDAARVDGAGPWQLFRYVQLPLSLGPALLGWFTGIALSLGELPVSHLLQYPGATPLSVRIFGLLHAGVYNEVAAITLLLVAFVFALGAVMILVARYMRRRVPGR